MKEKIINILVKYFIGYAEIIKAAAELETLINQEVEKRIKERMPSEEECVDWAKDETLNIDGGDNKRITFYLMVGCKWLRSRLTCSEKPNNSQKSEGGEG